MRIRPRISDIRLATHPVGGSIQRLGRFIPVNFSPDVVLAGTSSRIHRILGGSVSSPTGAKRLEMAEEKESAAKEARKNDTYYPGFTDVYPDGYPVYYDRKGAPITQEKWLELFGQDGYKRIKLDQVGAYIISTVWLGMNHNFSHKGAPIIFETMVFSEDDWISPIPGLRDLDCERYATEVAALIGHDKMVERVKEAIEDFDKQVTELVAE